MGTALRILETASALERLRPRENMAIVRIRREPDEPPLYERVGPNAHVQGTVARAVEGLVNGRFGEAVYFHPDEFAASLGLDRMALTRAIRNLAGDSPWITSRRSGATPSACSTAPAGLATWRSTSRP